LEEELQSASERSAMLSEELSQRLEEHRGLYGQLEEAEEALASTQEELDSQRGATTSRAQLLEELSGTLAEFGQQLAEVTVEAASMQADLAASEQALQEERDQARARGRELEASRAQASQLEQRCAQLQEARVEALRLQKELQQLSEGERRARADAEGRLQVCEHEKADLARQLQHYRCEQHLHERNRADLAEREELSVQRQSDLLVRIEDLRKGLDEEATHSRRLKEQAEASEFFCQQLKAALRRYSPEDLRSLEEEHEESAAANSSSMHAMTPESELAQVRVENRRLHAQLTEQRLRGAEEAKRSAQACAKLRHLEKQGSFQVERSTGEPAIAAWTSETTQAPRPHSQSEDISSSLPGQPDSAREASVQPSARTAAAALGGRATGGQAPAPRCSILKKSKASSFDFFDKENRPGSLNCLGSHPEGPKAKSTFTRAKRPGLIGCVG